MGYTANNDASSKISIPFPFDPHFVAKVKAFTSPSPLNLRLCHKSVHGSTSSPCTGRGTLKINWLAVHPERVEGRMAKLRYNLLRGERGKLVFFEDLRRELVSWKYSYKPIKIGTYFNRDLIKSGSSGFVVHNINPISAL